MKNLKQVLVLVTFSTLILACGGGTAKQPATADGFTDIEKEIKSEFGDDAYYTELTIIYNETIGNSISTTVTDEPESMKMEQWTYSMGNWKQTSEITLEVPDGTKAADFMFQLDEKINLNKLGELVENSSQQLTEEKDIENPKLEMAFIQFPKSGDIDKTEYYVKLKPENGGTSFTFSYRLDGSLIEMDY